MLYCCQTPPMKGRRSAALLCVLLSHALVVWVMLSMRAPEERSVLWNPFGPIPIAAPENLISLEPERIPTLQPYVPSAEVPAPSLPGDAMEAAAEEGTSTLPQDVDWPLEGKRAVKRVLDAEEESERIAKKFSGPKGTWASLTPRERSEVKKFRWKKGVVPERDENGNAIVQISEGCVLVNLSFLACALGKKAVYGDLFKDMRKYFDEQRLPETGNGNGR